MQVRAEQLAQSLKQSLARCYLVTGDEALLVQECADAIRVAAREAGCTEREVIEISSQGGEWQQLLQSAGALSLFADKKLIEVRLPSGKPGTEGSKAIQEYLAIDGDDVLLLVAGKIDKQSQRAKWYTQLDKAGVIVTLWPIKTQELPRWLGQRMQAAGLQVDREALSLLAERVEGNLLAAVQEVEKLKLLADNGKVTIDTVIASVADNARYNSFGLADTALAGDTRGAIRTLRGLAAEATAAPVALWALARDVKLLAQLADDGKSGLGMSQAMQQRGVWRSRSTLVQGAMNRHNADTINTLQALVYSVDAAIKGFTKDDPWLLLEQLLVLLCLGHQANNHRRRA